MASSSQWSELPDLLLDAFVCRLSSVVDIFAFASVCRPWRSFLLRSSSRYLSAFPPFVADPFPKHSPCTKSISFRTIDAPRRYKTSLPSQYRDLDLLGFSHSYLIFVQCLNDDYETHLKRSNAIYLEDSPEYLFQPILIDPFTGHEIRLPTLTREYSRRCFYHAALTSPPSDPNSILLVISSVDDFRSLRISSSDPHWSYHHFYTHCSLRVHFTVADVIHYRTNQNQRTRLLAVSTTADKILDFTDFDSESLSTIKVYDVQGGIRRTREMDQYRSQLIQCGARLLLLRYSAYKRFLQPPLIRRIDVYELDFERMAWVRVDDIGDYALFVDCKCRGSAMCSTQPERWGGKRNRVYVIGSRKKLWNEYPLNTDFPGKDQNIGHKFFDQLSPIWSYIWAYPTMRFDPMNKHN